MPCIYTSYFTACFVRLPFKGGVYFFGKPGNINDGWVRHVLVRWWRLLDTVSSTRSLSVLLSAIGTTHTTQTVLALVWWPGSPVTVPTGRSSTLLKYPSLSGISTYPSSTKIIDSGSTQRKKKNCLSYSLIDLPSFSKLRLLFEGGIYFVQELRIVWLLFKGSNYLRVASIWRNTVFTH